VFEEKNAKQFCEEKNCSIFVSSTAIKAMHEFPMSIKGIYKKCHILVAMENQ